MSQLSLMLTASARKKSLERHDDDDNRNSFGWQMYVIWHVYGWTVSITRHLERFTAFVAFFFFSTRGECAEQT